MDLSRLKADLARWQTGLVLLAVVAVVGIFHTPWIIWAFFGIIFILAFHESIALFGADRQRWLYVVAVVIWLSAAFYPKPEDLIVPALILLASIVAFNQKLEAKALLPLLYPTLPMLLLFSLYLEFGILSLLWLLFIVVSCDVGAYFAGKLLGRTPFSPSSPNKTVEGVAGGVTAAVILGSIVGLLLAPAFWVAFVVSLLVAVASIFGDLFESYLKRQAGVKDSGTILPGHGGILDRVDGYLFAGAVLLIALRALN